MTKSSPIPKFGLNRPKNYLGYVLATDIAASADEVARLLDEHNIVGDSKLARRGAERLNLVTGPESVQLTVLGEELLNLANQEFGSAEAALDELGKLYGKGDRLIEAQPVWREFLQETLRKNSGVNRLLGLLQDIHAETGAERFDLPEVFFEMYRRDPEFAGEIFLRENEVQTQLPLSLETLDSDPLETSFADPELYYGPTVQTLKSILYHAGFLTTKGTDARSLQPGNASYIWALESAFRTDANTESSQLRTSELADPNEKAIDYKKPDRKDITTSRIIRNSKIVIELKERYDYTCQVCGERRKHDHDKGYAEGHHIRPLGDDHNGKDTKENILVLCPICHVDFDYGMVRVDLDDYEIIHAYDSGRDGCTLTIANGHNLDDDWLRYHNQFIAGFCDL